MALDGGGIFKTAPWSKTDTLEMEKSGSREHRFSYICTMDSWEIIKTQRKTLKLTQKQVADLLGMTRNRYNRIESGKADISLREFCSLCGVLELTIYLRPKVNAENSWELV